MKYNETVRQRVLGMWKLYNGCSTVAILRGALEEEEISCIPHTILILKTLPRPTQVRADLRFIYIYI